MNPRKVAYLAAIFTAAASLYYFFVYLTRWEWNRALTSGVIFLAAEIALIGALVLDRIGKLRTSLTRTAESQTPSRRREPRPDVLARIRESAPEPRNPFAWLEPRGTNVFVPVLLGAGVVLSAVAWVVERVARATAGRQMERGLALRLETLAPPAGLVSAARDGEPLALFAPAPATLARRDGSVAP